MSPWSPKAYQVLAILLCQEFQITLLNLGLLWWSKAIKTPKLNTIWLELVANVLSMLIGLKGNNYYSKVVKRVNYKLWKNTFWVVIKGSSSVYMLYSGVSWAMDLFTIFFILFYFLSCQHFSSYLFVYILCSIICLCYHVFFHAMSDDLSHFNASRTVVSLFTPISWTLVQRSLVEKFILSERIHVHHCLRVYSFHCVFWVELVCWYLEYVQVKNK